MTRYREIRHTNKQQQSNSRRPQCPDYDTTMQRICGGNSVPVNGNMPGTTSSSAGGSGMSMSTKNTHLPSSHHHRSNAPHHREDIV